MMGFAVAVRHSGRWDPECLNYDYVLCDMRETGGSSAPGMEPLSAGALSQVAELLGDGQGELL